MLLTAKQLGQVNRIVSLTKIDHLSEEMKCYYWQSVAKKIKFEQGKRDGNTDS